MGRFLKLTTANDFKDIDLYYTIGLSYLVIIDEFRYDIPIGYYQTYSAFKNNIYNERIL